jgi:hypothetical protein
MVSHGDHIISGPGAVVGLVTFEILRRRDSLIRYRR